MKSIKGTPWAFAPKAKGDHIPVEIKGDGSPTNPEGENVKDEPEITLEEDPNTSSKPEMSGYKGSGTIEFHIKKPMIQKYGYTDGCPACQKMRNMAQGGQSLSGRLGVNHSLAQRICESL